MKILNIISLLLCGISIGWLMGLSASPVIQTVLSSMLAVITSTLSLLLSFQEGMLKEKITDKLGVINVIPLSVFLVGLSLSATAGVYARANDWYGIDPVSFKNKWEIKDKDKSGIIKRLYEELHGRDSGTSNSVSQGVLFNNSENCAELLKMNDAEGLMSELRTLGPEWQLFADSVETQVKKKEQIGILKKMIVLNCK